MVVINAGIEIVRLILPPGDAISCVTVSVAEPQVQIPGQTARVTDRPVQLVMFGYSVEYELP